MAVVDTSRGWIGVCEFVDNDQLSTFESVVVQQGVCHNCCLSRYTVLITTDVGSLNSDKYICVFSFLCAHASMLSPTHTGAKECLMAEAVDSPDGQKLAHIAERSRMLVSPRKKSECRRAQEHATPLPHQHPHPHPTNTKTQDTRHTRAHTTQQTHAYYKHLRTLPST